MRQKIIQRCTEVVTPSLPYYELVELIETGEISMVSAGPRQNSSGGSAGSTGSAPRGAVATGARPFATSQPHPYFLVVTNKRLILLENVGRAVGDEIVAAIPLDLITPGRLRHGPFGHRLEATVENDVYRFGWGPLQGGSARRVHAMLTNPPTN